MEQIYFGDRICALRKEQGMTQEAMARKLGVTNQAVSKWESDQCCPDIMQLPALADLFGISIDTLFGRAEPQISSAPEAGPEYWVEGLPWENDDNLHAVCYVGHRLVSFRDIPAAGSSRGRFPFNFSCMGFDMRMARESEPVVLEFSGSVNNIYSDYSVSCQDSEVAGNIQAGDSVRCGTVKGDVHAGDSVTVTGDICGSAQAGDNIHCEGRICANATAGGDLQCADIGGRVQCSGDLECRGSIGGEARAEGDLHCSGDILGSVNAEGDVECQGNIKGNVCAEGDIECSGSISGNATAGGSIACSSIFGNSTAD